MTDNELQEIKAKHPNKKLMIVEFPLPDGETVKELVMTVPNAAQYAKFQSEALDDELRGRCFKNLVLLCALSPDAAGMTQFLQEYPASTTIIGNRLLAAAGLTGKASYKLV